MSAGLAPALTDYRPIETSFEGYKREQSSIDAPPVEQQGPVARDHVLSGGRPSWPLVEYLFHRYVPYGRFPPGESLLGGLVHEMLDTLHREQHHEKPFDGRHINAQLKDFLPLFFVARPSVSCFPCTRYPPSSRASCKAMLAKRGRTISCISDSLAIASSGISGDVTFTIMASAGWKTATGSLAGYWTACSIRSTESRFAGPSPKATATRFVSRR